MRFTSPNGSSNSRRRTVLVALAIAAFLALCVIVCLLGVGRWLVIQDPLQKSQAIAVLSGRMPVRAIEAAQLYRAGYASQIWLTHTKEPAATLESMHIGYIGEDFFNERVLMHEGVPRDAIRVLDPPIDNTADEMRVIAAELQLWPNRRVIIVTTKAHTRRTRTLWRRLGAARGQAIVRGADDGFDPKHWWRSTSDALDVVREVLGLLNAWAGLPLQPSS